VVLSLALSWHLVRFGSVSSNRADLKRAIPYVLLTTILIVTIVSASLPLSIGLLGALSIVRFRTPVKEAEELAYLFTAVAFGVGLGAGKYALTLVTAMVILLLTSILSYRRADRSGRTMYLVVDWKQREWDAQETLSYIRNTIDSRVGTGELMRLDERDGAFEVTYALTSTDHSSVLDLLGDLRKTAEGLNVTIVDQRQFPSSV
jgi:uncharacterized membrane protein YhiD involved in acid resistance